MRRFTYARPQNVEEVIHLLVESGTSARLLAGGTDLVIAMRDREVQPEIIVDIKRIAEFYPAVRWNGEMVTLSATAVMGAIADDQGIRQFFPGLLEAVLAVGSVQIRNRATLVGNICNGSPAADTAPPLLVYGAVVVVTGPDGTRRVPIDDFIVGPHRTTLEPGELVAAVELPVPGRPTGSAYQRMTRRRGTDLASVTLCCGVDDTGTTRMAYGSVGPRPLLRIDKNGVLADPAAPEEAKAAVFDDMFAAASPSLTSLRASPDYRQAMLRVLGARALRTATERLVELQGLP